MYKVKIGAEEKLKAVEAYESGEMSCRQTTNTSITDVLVVCLHFVYRKYTKKGMPSQKSAIF